MNKTTVHGNITATPELRVSRSGVPVATFTVATNRRRYNRQSGAWVDLPSVFHRVVCFNALAENVAASLAKGATVAVTGEFADDSYTPDGGTLVRRIQIEASDVAASLRYATATITKNQRNGSAPAADDPERDTPTAGGGADEGADERDRPALTVVAAD